MAGCAVELDAAGEGQARAGIIVREVLAVRETLAIGSAFTCGKEGN